MIQLVPEGHSDSMRYVVDVTKTDESHQLVHVYAPDGPNHAVSCALAAVGAVHVIDYRVSTVEEYRAKGGK